MSVSIGVLMRTGLFVYVMDIREVVMTQETLSGRGDKPEGDHRYLFGCIWERLEKRGLLGLQNWRKRFFLFCSVITRGVCQASCHFF